MEFPKAKPEWIQKVPGLNDYQDMLIEKAVALAVRGFFRTLGTLGTSPPPWSNPLPFFVARPNFWLRRRDVVQEPGNIGMASMARKLGP